MTAPLQRRGGAVRVLRFHVRAPGFARLPKRGVLRVRMGRPLRSSPSSGKRSRRFLRLAHVEKRLGVAQITSCCENVELVEG